MIYEWREYQAAPGKRSELLARFEDHTFALFEKHGIRVVGFWVAQDDPDWLCYLCEFADEEERARAWSRFQSDPVWQDVKRRSEANGSLTSSMTSRVLTPLPWRESR
ncbi:MAG: NIPSNAP family protein [Alicyclobacillus macrosporangiidus]|uniref:NIPSNAP family protein n=1 Tax=Alicyclobacillus macrosporangiidus TaxID=392015 RepID=UPI0026F1E2BA|nr:NIPSNAP family protein [Alicyclobacillus macrosporangiidus]MCL6598901.1 NIPSNAP family protein [Alicyclobacillus macrosporangiidus]